MRIAITTEKGVQVHACLGLAISSNRTLIAVVPGATEPLRMESAEWSTVVVQTTGGDKQ